MPAKTQLLWARLKRGFTSIPTADLLVSILVVVAIITIAVPLIGGQNMTPENSQFIWHVLEAAIAIGFVLLVILVIKTRLEYRRRTYDPTLIFEFQKAFDLLEDTHARCKAAKVCMAFLKAPEDSRNWQAFPRREQEELEPVLDFLEDLGFYLRGDQFSEEVAHHHFFHWIRGWYSNLESYVEYYRDVRNEKAAYENIEPLYKR